MLTDARAADVPRTPTIEVPLTIRAPRPRERAKLARAWTRVGALGFAALIGCAVVDWHSIQPIGAVLVASTYALTVAALWSVALETRQSNRRGAVDPPGRRAPSVHV